MSFLILMATFNGAPWLPEQLATIRAQTDEDWRLLVSDDGSSDATWEILEAVAQEDPRITLLPQNAGVARGSAGNFEHLLRAATEHDQPLLCLADQDDRWQPDKLASQRASLAGALVAVSSDPELIGETGQVGEAGLPQSRMLACTRAVLQPTFTDQLAQNAVVGCTLAFRRELLALALPFPPQLVNHDWWLGLCALCLGKLEVDSRSQVAYRQHATNAVGAYRPARQWRSIGALLHRQRRVLRSNRLAVATLIERLGSEGRTVPEALLRYRELWSQHGRLGLALALQWGEFAPPFPALRWLRCLAVLRGV